VSLVFQHPFAVRAYRPPPRPKKLAATILPSTAIKRFTSSTTGPLVGATFNQVFALHAHSVPLHPMCDSERSLAPAGKVSAASPARGTAPASRPSAYPAGCWWGPSCTGSVGTRRCSTCLGSSSARSRPFELNFLYFRLESILMLGCRKNPNFGRFSCRFFGF
jgi:hypothetical protein